MSGCAICGHKEHDGRRCDYPITEDVRDDVGIFAGPTFITRTIIVGTCACGLLDSLVKPLGIDVDDLITPITER